MYEIDGAAVERARMDAFLTQRELAERAGLTQSTVSRLELGKQSAQAGTVKKLAAALGVMPDAIATPAEKKPAGTD